MDIDLLGNLNPAQREAVTHKEGPLMIVAGAGTGKTTVVTTRIAWLIDQGLAKPEEILALTFTDKAAGEMEERIDRLLPYGYVDLQISTFHAFAEHLLREHGVEIGLSRDFKLVNELDAWLLTRQNFDRFDLSHYRPLGNPTKYMRALLTHFSRAKDLGVDPEHYLTFVEEQTANLDSAQAGEEVTSELARLDELARAYHTYQTILLENDSLDFGDLMLYTLKILKERPTVRDSIRQQYKFILVDEFQDTNDAQYEIVKLLAEPRRNLTVVGDDDQSIYKFRGASLANILQFQDDFQDAKQVVLTANYRSAQCILDHAHEFIQHNNPDRLEASSDGKLSKKLEGQLGTDGHIEHLHASSLQEEVVQVAGKILTTREQEPETNWSDFAILVRSNSAGMDFAQVLEKHKIPYQFMALSGLYTKESILDMMAFMRAIEDPFDSPSIYRLLTMPLHGIDDRSIIELNQFARRKGKSLFEACERLNMLESIDPGEATRIRTLLTDLEIYRKEAKKRPVSELFVLVAKQSGYLEYVNSLNERQKLDEFGYLQQFYQRLKSFERRADEPTLHHFLKEYAHERDAGEDGSLSVDLEAGPDVVKIMTIHAAKGLEFQHVFVVNMVDRRFPTSSRADAIPLPEGLGVTKQDTKEAHLQEERRLFYVAITRAKKALYFTSALDYGGSRKKKISRFLHELGYEQPETAAAETVDISKEHTDNTPDTTEPHIPIPKRFSFTQLAAFKSCPLQYKFAHVLKVPVMGKWNFSFGKTMHNTWQKFFELWLERTGTVQTSLFDNPNATTEDGLPVSKQELMELYKQAWQDEWYTDDAQREEYRAEGEKSLKDLYKKMLDERPDPLYIEQGFTLKFGDIILKGRIDRIDRFEDGVEIVDYKTGTPKTKLSKDDKEQLLLYQLAARDVLGINPKKLTFLYLKDNTSVSFIGTDEELQELEESIIRRVQNIRKSNFEAKPGRQCTYCDFKDICSFAQK